MTKRDGGATLAISGGAFLPTAKAGGFPRTHSGEVATTSDRFAVRLTPEQVALIRRAAEVEGTDLTTFTVSATVAHAQEVLAERGHFLLDAGAWADFTALLDRPVQHNPALVELFAKPSLFDAEG